MNLEQIHLEHQLLEQASKRTIEIDIPNGFRIVCLNSWDYKTNLTETSLKTTTHIEKTHPLLIVEQLDLKPISSKKVWKVTVLRKPKSDLTDDPSKRKKPRMPG